MQADGHLSGCQGGMPNHIFYLSYYKTVDGLLRRFLAHLPHDYCKIVEGGGDTQAVGIELHGTAFREMVEQSCPEFQVVAAIDHGLQKQAIVEGIAIVWARWCIPPSACP